MSASSLFAGSVSSLYAKVRPTVSQALIDTTLRFLADEKSGPPPYDLIVDVGCGTGLNTQFLAPHFKKFIGLDVSSTQIEEAKNSSECSNTIYEVNDSTTLPCRNESVDLITVIQAAHWLDHDRFFKECDRVLVPGSGVIALMGYSVPGLTYNPFPRSRSALSAAMKFFYDQLVKTGSWHSDRYILDRQYKDITLPYKDQLIIRSDPELYLYKDMAVRTWVDYLSTWSGYREFNRRYPDVDILQETKSRILAALPGHATEDTILTGVFPWFVLMCRKKMNNPAVHVVNGDSMADLEPYRWQIAGHKSVEAIPNANIVIDTVGLLRDRNTRCILKPVQAPPRGDREVHVYERIWNDNNNDQDILRTVQSLVPRYFGKRRVMIKGEPHWYLQLEDITAGFEKPCVTDIKIGAQTWDPSADAQKIISERSKYTPYAERLCFRFLGMIVWQQETGTYLIRDKHWGKKVTDNDVIPVLGEFFNIMDNQRLIIVDRVLEKLRAVEEWFSKSTGYAFYSSSVLIVYDAADMGASGHPRVDVRMIDFTHIFDHQGCDMNYLNGIRSLIRHLELYKIGSMNSL